MTSPLSGRRILVVEDESMVAWALEDMLADLGCTVVGSAARVDQALAMVATHAFDAAVLDINLNGEGSYPIADALISRGLPFVFSTGYNQSSLPAAYSDLPFMQKPLERSRLSTALTKLLSPGLPVQPEQRAVPQVWDTNRLRIATDAAGVALWSWHVDTDEIDMDERAHGLWGVAGARVTFTELSAHIHPEDQDRVRAAFAATREILGAYEVEFRIMHGPDVRWISARGRGDDEGIIDRIMFGVFLDVTERKLAEEARELLAGEMGHRVKNLFSIAIALTAISARSTTTTAEMSRDIAQRLTALSRAHDLVRPVLSQPKQAVRLGDLLGVLLAPYDDRVLGSERVQVAVPEWLVGEASATTIALVMHELATNSIKYGALSSATGTLDLSGVADDGELVLTWRERGGPPVDGPRASSGFGSKLMTRSVTDQLGGRIEFDWPAEGVVVTIAVNKARLGG